MITLTKAQAREAKKKGQKVKVHFYRNGEGYLVKFDGEEAVVYAYNAIDSLRDDEIRFYELMPDDYGVI